MELKRVVITGLGTLNPLGNTIEDYWNGLVNGVSGADLITRFDPSEFKTKFGCELKNFDPSEHIEKKELRKIDRFVVLALVAAKQALEDSNLDLGSLDFDRAGVIWGSGIGGLETITNEVKDFHKSIEEGRGPRLSPFFVPKMISDIAAGHISMKFGFRGPNYATVSACASSSHAIADSFNYIRLGKAKVFITGGSEACITNSGVAGFSSMRAISTRNDDPKTASRPFDADRDGFVMGEGSGALVLEEYEHAKARGAKIYAEVVGAGLTADAHHLTAPHPEGLGAKMVMKFALEDAELNPEDVDYINVHGTATPLGDISEVLAIKSVFGEHAYKLNISSTKSMTGHLLGAAGAIESIATVLAMNNNIVPPTINHFTDDPKIDNKLNFTFNKAQKREVNIALSNTFGFGGHNASLVFKKI